MRYVASLIPSAGVGRRLSHWLAAELARELHGLLFDLILRDLDRRNLHLEKDDRTVLVVHQGADGAVIVAPIPRLGPSAGCELFERGVGLATVGLQGGLVTVAPSFQPSTVYSTDRAVQSEAATIERQAAAYSTLSIRSRHGELPYRLFTVESCKCYQRVFNSGKEFSRSILYDCLAGSQRPMGCRSHNGGCEFFGVACSGHRHVESELLSSRDLSSQGLNSSCKRRRRPWLGVQRDHGLI
jgi:hypothetical protein